MKKREDKIRCDNKQCPKRTECEKYTVGCENNLSFMNCKYYI